MNKSFMKKLRAFIQGWNFPLHQFDIISSKPEGSISDDQLTALFNHIKYFFSHQFFIFIFWQVNH